MFPSLFSVQITLFSESTVFSSFFLQYKFLLFEKTLYLLVFLQCKSPLLKKTLYLLLLSTVQIDLFSITTVSSPRCTESSPRRTEKSSISGKMRIFNPPRCKAGNSPFRALFFMPKHLPNPFLLSRMVLRRQKVVKSGGKWDVHRRIQPQRGFKRARIAPFPFS